MLEAGGHFLMTAVMRKPESYPSRRLALVRLPLLWWANRSADAALPPRARKASEESSGPVG